MKIVIFGNGRFASLAWYCITHDSKDEVAGFTVDAPYITDHALHGLPVVDFARVEERFLPRDHAMLVHIGPTKMNLLRKGRVEAARCKGYRLASYISSRAMTWPDLRVGANCAVYEGTIIQPFACIGDNVIIRSGAHISHHVSIGDHCFVAAGACIGGGAVVEQRCFIGLNATIRDGVRIAEGCLIAAGAVIMTDTKSDGVYSAGNSRRASIPASQFL